jgi:hypothetical protein
MRPVRRHRQRSQRLDVRPQDRAREVVVARRVASFPVDEEPRAPRGGQVFLALPGLGREDFRPGFGGVAQDRRYAVEEAVGIPVEMTGQRI